MRNVHVAADPKPLSLRFDVVNAFDTRYQVRDGCGIDVFAPAIRAAPRVHVGLSQKL